jgi:hypothetical protein
MVSMSLVVVPGKKGWKIPAVVDGKGVVVWSCRAASSSERAAMEYACRAIAIERIVECMADRVPDRCGRV